jgi:hypothetical protein
MCFVLYVSGPAHIRYLNVTSGWNNEQCISAIEIIVTLIAAASILVEMFDPWGLHVYGYVSTGC